MGQIIIFQLIYKIENCLIVTNGNIEGRENYDSIIRDDLNCMNEEVLTKYKCTAKISTKTHRVYYVKFSVR